MSLYPSSVGLMSKMLQNLSGWLDQAEAYASERGFEVDVLVTSRLRPDQFALSRQIQSACDSAKFAGSRLAAKEAPKHEDNESTVAELKERIASTLSFLETVSEADLEGAEERHIVLPFLPDRFAYGRDYLNQFALPNFFFHLNHAYAILRYNGVPLGKRTYLGEVTTHPNA